MRVPNNSHVYQWRIYIEGQVQSAGRALLVLQRLMSQLWYWLPDEHDGMVNHIPRASSAKMPLAVCAVEALFHIATTHPQVREQTSNRSILCNASGDDACSCIDRYDGLHAFLNETSELD